MKQTRITLTVLALSVSVMAQGTTFDSDQIGAVPAGWTCGITGKGSPRWAIASESSTAEKVLLQSGSGTYPRCVKADTALADGFVEVKFKPIAGREDQAGGVLWRWKDGESYYVARANALENNVSLYYTERGNRKTLKYVNAPVARDVWHALRVEFSGTRIVVSLDGKRYIELDDAHIAGAGAVGIWTKADSVTAFKEFHYGAVRR
jgi:hypothetical protein